MNNFVDLFTLAPVIKGCIAMIIAGAGFPLCGVMVLRLDLIPMRYMLMHGVILGGAISLGLSLPLMPVVVTVNILLVALMLALTRDSSFGFGMGSSAAMVFSMAIASLLIHKLHVPANDTLGILWGSPFALLWSDILALGFVSAIVVIYVVVNFRKVIAIFYHQDVAQSIGIPVRLHYAFMLLLIAFTIALAMKLLGALLIDALLILPVIIATRLIHMQKAGGGIKKLFATSSFVGIMLSICGFVAAVIFDLPPSAAIAALAGIAYLAVEIPSRRGKK